jgi:carbohydrate kinase (thermoresistant glucokinase family)
MAVAAIVVMGVSGAGKSTVAGLLAGQLGWDLAEGDELHPPANVAKMAAGMPLTDADRAPWLARVASWIDDELAAGRHGVITCSALKRAYRELLARPAVLFVYLAVPRAELERRLTSRHGHFMPRGLLDSQLEALQPPAEDELALTVDGSSDPARVVELIRAELSARGRLS